jgi:hypothetical protein
MTSARRELGYLPLGRVWRTFRLESATSLRDKMSPGQREQLASRKTLSVSANQQVGWSFRNCREPLTGADGGLRWPGQRFMDLQRGHVVVLGGRMG